MSSSGSAKAARSPLRADSSSVIWTSAKSSATAAADPPPLVRRCSTPAVAGPRVDGAAERSLVLREQGAVDAGKLLLPPQVVAELPPHHECRRGPVFLVVEEVFYPPFGPRPDMHGLQVVSELAARVCIAAHDQDGAVRVVPRYRGEVEIAMDLLQDFG